MASSAQLRARIEQMQQKLADQEAIEQRKGALSEVKALVEKWGFTPQEIGQPGRGQRAASGKSAKPATSARPPMFINKDTGKTWNGRGPTPSWLPKDKAKRDAFRIVGADAQATSPATDAIAAAPDAAKAGRKKAVKRGAKKNAAAKAVVTSTTAPAKAKRQVAKKMPAAKKSAPAKTSATSAAVAKTTAKKPATPRKAKAVAAKGAPAKTVAKKAVAKRAAPIKVAAKKSSPKKPAAKRATGPQGAAAAPQDSTVSTGGGAEQAQP
ncbi:MAG: hypothetical protein E6R08_00820 [Nevskiaceae bacterium]|nr:MAG: hypothetical protein E6R08_00820 [Nevskiaceae bacterium]